MIYETKIQNHSKYEPNKDIKHKIKSPFLKSERNEVTITGGLIQ